MTDDQENEELRDHIGPLSPSNVSSRGPTSPAPQKYQRPGKRGGEVDKPGGATSPIQKLDRQESEGQEKIDMVKEKILKLEKRNRSLQ